MMKHIAVVIAALFLGLSAASAGPASGLVRETSEWVLKKFGAGRLGKSVDEIAAATARTIEKHGDDALPMLRSAGHAGFEALETAGKQAPDVIKLFAKKGDEAVWLISKPGKLAIFLKHGDGAADALLKHPGLADDLIERFGSKALAPLNRLEKSGAQQLAMAANEGVFNATGRSGELFDVVARLGDGAMSFIWRNKGSLVVAATLTAFLNDPELFINSGKDLIVESAIKPLSASIRWDWIGYCGTALVIMVGIAIFRRLTIRRKAR